MMNSIKKADRSNITKHISSVLSIFSRMSLLTLIMAVSVELLTLKADSNLSSKLLETRCELS